MLNLLVVVLISLLFPTILVIFSTLGSSHRKKCGAPNVPRGNTGWPVIGETIAFLKPYPATSTGEFMVQRVSRFGNVFMSHLFGKPTVVSADAQFNRFIFQNDLKMFVPGWPSSVIKMLGKDTILNLVGDEHKFMRSMILTFFRIGRLQTVLLRDLDMSSVAFLSSWKGKNIVPAMAEARKFTFGMMAKNILSMEPEDPETEKLRREFETMSTGMVSFPLNFPGTPHWKALKSRSNILTLIKQKREERIKKMRDGGTDVEDDLLTWTLEHANYTEERTGDFLLGFLFGGHDTSSKAIALAIYFLDGCPKALEQLRHAVIAKKKEEKEKPDLSWEDYKQMEFTQCVFYETLRLGNVAKYVQRKAVEDARFKGHVIPQGFSVLVSFSAVHLDPSLFEDPEQFNPWRWKVPSGIKKTQDFMAFGGGSRLCPGADFARLEFALFLHHLILSYRWEMVGPDQPFTYPYVDFPGGLHIKIHTLED